LAIYNKVSDTATKNRLLVKFEQSTGVRAAADAERILMKTSTQSLLLSQEDNPQRHRTAI